MVLQNGLYIKRIVELSGTKTKAHGIFFLYQEGSPYLVRGFWLARYRQLKNLTSYDFRNGGGGVQPPLRNFFWHISLAIFTAFWSSLDPRPFFSDRTTKYVDSQSSEFIVCIKLLHGLSKKRIPVIRGKKHV